MRTFGLVGYPLTHSFSQAYFEEKFAKENIRDAIYKLLPITEAGAIKNVLDTEKNLAGLNVTIPYKESILPFLHALDETAEEVGAVNCIKVTTENGNVFLKGYNTDVFGFSHAIKPFLESQHQKALILGTGGAAKAVHYVLEKLGIDCCFVSRKPTHGNPRILAYEQLNEAALNNFKLIVNATPVGMFPAIDQCPPLPYEYLDRSHFVFDLVYNPGETLLLKKAKEKGALIQNGLSMLRLQAEKAWEIWNS